MSLLMHQFSRLLHTRLYYLQVSILDLGPITHLVKAKGYCCWKYGIIIFFVTLTCGDRVAREAQVMIDLFSNLLRRSFGCTKVEREKLQHATSNKSTTSFQPMVTMLFPTESSAIYEKIKNAYLDKGYSLLPVG